MHVQAPRKLYVTSRPVYILIGDQNNFHEGDSQRDHQRQNQLTIGIQMTMFNGLFC